MSEWTGPGPGSTLVFLLVVAAVAITFVVGVRRAGRATGEPTATTARWTRGAAIGVVSWMTVTGLASFVLDPSLPAPAVMGFFVGCNATGAALAFSPVGTRLRVGSRPPGSWLRTLSGFRSSSSCTHGRSRAVPVQMTFEGHNFDILTGIAALLLGLYALRKTPPRAVVLAVNALGLALLVAVGTIAVLSTPTPLRAYQGPPLMLAYSFPYGWIVPMCVSAAFFLHLVAFRALAAGRGGKPPRP